MKKVLPMVLAILLIFAGCSEDVNDSDAKNPSNNSIQSFISSIFGRNVTYDAVTPASDLTLPISSDEIANMIQIENILYFLGNDGVYTLDIETGESKKLIDSPPTGIAAHDGMLYTYSAETSAISEYDNLGNLTKEITLEITDDKTVEGLFVTDDYYILACDINGGAELLIYSRDTQELTLSKNLSLTGLYSYKDNKLLFWSKDSVFGALSLNAVDADNGKSEKLIDRVNGSYAGNNPAVAYCPKTDTAVIYGSVSNNGESPCCVTEYSLDSTDSIVLNRYYLEVSNETRFFVSVYENIISAVSSADNECRVYDYLNPPESITILGNATVQEVVYGFEKETGILVKNAYTEFDKLVYKLLAGDNDFDIYNTGSGFHNYVDSDTFVDLKGIESLNSRISGSLAADLMVNYDGKYFGVPTDIYNWWTEDIYPEDGSTFSYSLVISENIYYAENIDVAEKRYSDPDGDELYKLFKFIYNNPGGNKDEMPFGDDTTILDSNVYLLNPNSQNTENAIRFLEYLFDAYNGDIPDIVLEDELYPTLESTENIYVSWRCRPLDIIDPIMGARNAIQYRTEDISDSELKKMAKEAAAEVAMRMAE